MTIDDFMEKALKGGLVRNAGLCWCDSCVLLSPEAWKAVGKVEGWRPHRQPCQCEDCYFMTVSGWNDYMHRMIDALVEGRSIEAYLETL